MGFTGVFLVLVLASGSALGQPTYDVSDLDDFYHWKDGRWLLEQAVTAFQRILEQQERQQREHGERMERLEQTLNESVTGQRRLEMQVSQLQQQHQQQVDSQVNEMTRYASSQHDYHHRHQLAISSLMENVTARLEAISEDVNTIRDSVESIKSRPAAGNVSRTLVEEVKNLATRLADEQRSMLDAHDQKRQNQSVEQVEMITGTIAVIRQDVGQISDAIGDAKNATKMQNAVLYAVSDIVANASQKLAEIDDRIKEFHELSLRNVEFSQGQFESMTQVGSASLDELRELSYQISTQQQQQQTRDDMILGKILEMANDTAQSQLSLLQQYGRTQNSTGENTSRVLAMLTNISHSQDRQEAAFERAEERAVVIRQGQRELEQFIARELYQQVELLKVATVESAEVAASNLSMQLTDVGESCIRVISGTAEATQTQTQLLSEMLRLHEEAVVNNVSKLLEVAGAEEEKRSEVVRNAVIAAFENVTADLREMRDENVEVRDERRNRDLIFRREVVGILNNATKSQRRMFADVGEAVRTATNETSVLVRSHDELVERVRDKGSAIQTQLARVEATVLMQTEMLSSAHSSGNITAMIAETEDTCASIANSVNTGNTALVQEFQEQRRLVSGNARLLQSLARTAATSAQQSQQQHSNILSNITAQLQTLRGTTDPPVADPST